MAKFPESPLPNYSLVLTPKWQTQISQLGESYEQRTAKQLYPQFDVTVQFNRFPTHAQMMIIWDFYNSRKGAFQGFYIYDPQFHASVSPAHTGLYIDTADGATDTFDIPGRSTSSQTIYLDGVAQVLTTDYTISTGTGAESSDQVVFVSDPAAGEIITCDFTGVLRIPVRFASDRLSFEMFQTSVFRTGQINLHGLRFGT